MTLWHLKYVLLQSAFRAEVRVLAGISFALGSIVTLVVAKIWSLFL